MPAERCSAPVSDTTFASLGVPAPLVEALEADGITAPFPVQAATLPDGLAGRDILGRARTGSGKTLGFSLPLVTRLAGGQTASRRPRGLVLVPTRELATQVQAVLRPLAKAMGLWVTTIYGGVSYGPQVTALQRRTDIVVATPGRLADLIGQEQCDLSEVEITVIDEADQMADLGFLPIVRRLLETTPADGQRMLFSATLDGAIDVLARRFLSDPVLHSVDENSSPAEIEHHVLTIEPGHRIETVAALAGGDKRSLVFTRTKHGAERLARQLTESGIPAAELHGNLRQGARSRNLAAFAAGIARVMVATDIAARGIHIDGIDLVIHADPPAEHKAYVHRSGRTARGGADGVVVTLQTKAQARDVTQLMRKAGITPHDTVPAAPGSAVLTEIAGPPAPRVTVAGKVSELVRPEDRLSGGGPVDGRRSGSGRTRDGRTHRDRDRRRPDYGAGRSDNYSRPGRSDDRPAEHGRREFAPRGSGFRGTEDGVLPGRSIAAVPDSSTDRGNRNERADADERGWRNQSQRDAQGQRFGRDDRADRYTQDRSSRGDAGRQERATRFGSDQPTERGSRSGHGTGSERGGWAERGNRSERPDRGNWGDRGNQPERPERGGWAERGNRSERPDRGNWGDRGNRSGRESQDRPTRGDFGRQERPARFDGDARSSRDLRSSRDQWSGQSERGSGERSSGERGAQARGAGRGRDERPDRREWTPGRREWTPGRREWTPGRREWTPGDDRRDRSGSDWRPRTNGTSGGGRTTPSGSRFASGGGRAASGGGRAASGGGRAASGGGRAASGGRPRGGSVPGYSSGRNAERTGRDHRQPRHF